MEVPRLGVELELHLLAYTIATATQDLTVVCNQYHSSWQCRILNLLSKARDRTWNLMVPSQIHSPLSHNGNSTCLLLKTEVVFCKLPPLPQFWKEYKEAFQTQGDKEYAL